MRFWNKVVGISIGVAAVLLGILWFPLRGPSNLHAEYSVDRADIGIPGVTKMYDARLTNFSLGPIRIEVCAFVDDASTPGEAAAFSVQRFDVKSSSWVTIVDASDAKT